MSCICTLTIIGSLFCSLFCSSLNKCILYHYPCYQWDELILDNWIIINNLSVFFIFIIKCIFGTHTKPFVYAYSLFIYNNKEPNLVQTTKQYSSIDCANICITAGNELMKLCPGPVYMIECAIHTRLSNTRAYFRNWCVCIQFGTCTLLNNALIPIHCYVSHLLHHACYLLSI